MTVRWPPLADSLWAKTAGPPPETPPLAGDVEADVVVIGAGYCGVSTALHLARHARDVVVLEAFEPGHGASGRNNGHFQEFHARRSWGGGFFFFFDADGRLATGGPIGRGVNATLDQVNGRTAERLQAMFPQLGPVCFTHRWEGFFDVSASRTVGVHELAPRLYAVVGFSGRGIPTATAMGRDLAEMIVEDDVEAMAIPVAPLPRDPLGPVAEFLWHEVVLPVRWHLQG